MINNCEGSPALSRRLDRRSPEVFSQLNFLQLYLPVEDALSFFFFLRASSGTSGYVLPHYSSENTTNVDKIASTLAQSVLVEAHAHRVVECTALAPHKECQLRSKTGVKIILDVHFTFTLSLHSGTEPSEKAEKDYKTVHSANCWRRLLPKLKYYSINNTNPRDIHWMVVLADMK